MPISEAKMMMSRDSSRPRLSMMWRWTLPLMAIALFSVLLFGATGMTGATDRAASSQCVACHTDTAKLKALTPPDPPSSEAGEG